MVTIADVTNVAIDSLYLSLLSVLSYKWSFGAQVLVTSCKVMAPFTPFFTEVLYQNMRKVCEGAEESIHFCSFPQEEGKVIDHSAFYLSKK